MCHQTCLIWFQLCKIPLFLGCLLRVCKCTNITGKQNTNVQMNPIQKLQNQWIQNETKIPSIVCHFKTAYLLMIPKIHATWYVTLGNARHIGSLVIYLAQSAGYMHKCAYQYSNLWLQRYMNIQHGYAIYRKSSKSSFSATCKTAHWSMRNSYFNDKSFWAIVLEVIYTALAVCRLSLYDWFCDLILYIFSDISLTFKTPKIGRFGKLRSLLRSH